MKNKRRNYYQKKAVEITWYDDAGNERVTTVDPSSTLVTKAKRYFEELVGESEEVIVRFREDHLKLDGKFNNPVVSITMDKVILKDANADRDMIFSLESLKTLIITEGRGGYDYIINIALDDSQIVLWGILA